MPDEFFPGEFSLDDGPIEAVQTSESNPKVRLDASGLHAYDVNGNIIFDIDGMDGSATFKGEVELDHGNLGSFAAGGEYLLDTRKSVRWTRDGSTRGLIFSGNIDNAGTPFPYMQYGSSVPAGTPGAQTDLSIDEGNPRIAGGKTARVGVSIGSGVSAVWASAQRPGEFQSIKIIDSQGQSSFLRNFSSTRGEIALWGPFFVTSPVLNSQARSDQFVTLPFNVDQQLGWFPLGSQHLTDQLTWGYQRNTATELRVLIRNVSNVQAGSVQIHFFLLTFNN